MPIDYKVKLNNGNENIGAAEKTITVQEVVKTATNKDIAREVFLLNPLIPEQVTLSVLENFCRAAANLMAMGHAVILQSQGQSQTDQAGQGTWYCLGSCFRYLGKQDLL